MLWEYRNPAMHHDFVRLENGNTLIPEWVVLPEDVAKRVKGGWQQPRTPRPQLLGDDIIDIRSLRRRGEAAVCLETGRLIGNICVGEMGVEREFDPHLSRLGWRRFTRFQFRHGFGDHLDVQVEADGRQMARLYVAQNAPRASNLQIAHRQLETRAEVGKLTDCLQAAVRLFAQPLVFGVEQVGIGALRGSSDPPSQLIQLG